MPSLYPGSSTSAKSPLEALVQDQQVPLFCVTTVFPFRLFPTTVSVDKKKVDVIREIFYKSKHIQSILIQDIANVTVETNLFFAQLVINDRLPLNQPIVIEYLPKESAMKIRRIIEGLLVGDHAQIDTAQSSGDHFVSQLETIGRAKSTG